MKSLSVRTKIDLFLLPLLLVASSLAALDKNALSFAAILGITDDLKLHGQEYSTLGSIFYFGYLLMEFPTTWLLTRLPIGKYASTSLVLWGGCLCLMATCHSFVDAAAVRFTLGILEAGIYPACILLTGNWYRREEQPFRTALWFGPFSGILGGILAYAIARIQTALPTWKLLFLIYGGTTVLVGVMFLWLLPDNHENAWFLSHTECQQAKLRIIDNKTGLDMQKGWNLAQVTEALQDLKYWVVMLFGISQSITNAGITNFNTLILSGFGYSKEMSILLAAPQGVVTLTSQVIASFITLYVPNTRCLLWVLSCIPALVGIMIIQVVDVSVNRISALIGLWLIGFYNVSWVLVMSLITSNTAGATKKSFSSTSLAISYAVGNIIGPQFFLDSQKPHYPLGISAMFFAFLTMALCGIVYWTACIRQNNVRDRSLQESSRLLPYDDFEDMDDVTEVNHDRTDFEIPTFRYVY